MRRIDDSPEIAEARKAKERWDHVWKVFTTIALTSLCGIVAYFGQRAINAFDEMSRTQGMHSAQILTHQIELKSLRDDVTVLKAEMKGAATRVETLEALKRIEQRLEIFQLQGRASAGKAALRGAIHEEVSDMRARLAISGGK